MRGVEGQIEALAEHLSKIPKNVSPLPIYKQMEKLESLKSTLQNELDAILGSQDYSEEPAGMADYSKFLSMLAQTFRESASAEDKTKIIQALIAKVEFFPTAVKIHYKIGESVVQDFFWSDSSKNRT